MQLWLLLTLCAVLCAADRARQHDDDSHARANTHRHDRDDHGDGDDGERHHHHGGRDGGREGSHHVRYLADVERAGGWRHSHDDVTLSGWKAGDRGEQEHRRVNHPYKSQERRDGRHQEREQRDGRQHQEQHRPDGRHQERERPDGRHHEQVRRNDRHHGQERQDDRQQEQEQRDGRQQERERREDRHQEHHRRNGWHQEQGRRDDWYQEHARKDDPNQEQERRYGQHQERERQDSELSNHHQQSHGEPASEHDGESGIEPGPSRGSTDTSVDGAPTADDTAPRGEPLTAPDQAPQGDSTSPDTPLPLPAATPESAELGIAEEEDAWSAAGQQERPPPHENVAAMARYVVHAADWVALATISSRPPTRGMPAASTISMADGTRYRSTGVPYMYVSDLMLPVQDLRVNNSAALAVSLAMTEFCTRHGYDPQSPLCAHVVLSGSVRQVDEAEPEYALAHDALFARHPEMVGWPTDHGWFVARLDIQSIIVLDYFGGAKAVTPKEYFAASPFTVDEARQANRL